MPRPARAENKMHDDIPDFKLYTRSHGTPLCLLVNVTEARKTDAEKECRFYGANLVRIKTQEDMDIVNGMLVGQFIYYDTFCC